METMTTTHESPFTSGPMSPCPTDGTRPRILLVEDDTEMRRMLTAVLSADGFDVVEAPNGAAGVDELLKSWGFGGGHRRCFDLVVSDIRMPGWTGLEILEIVRSSRCHAHVILITAFGEDEIHEQALRLRAEAMFDKPFDLRTLRHTVQELLAA